MKYYTYDGKAMIITRLQITSDKLSLEGLLRTDIVFQQKPGEKLSIVRQILITIWAFGDVNLALTASVDNCVLEIIKGI